MKSLTKESLLQFMDEVQPTEIGFGWRAADLYDWLGGKSRLPSYYKMKTLPINAREPIATRLYNRLFNEFRRNYVQWVRDTFQPFLYSLRGEGEIKATSSRWGFIAFFEFKPQRSQPER